MGSGLTSSTTRTVRIVFAVTFLWIAIGQYVFLGVEREEPYPAVILPGFPARCPGCLLETGVAAANEPQLIVRLSDGRTQQVAVDRILPPGPSVQLMVFTAAFEDGRVASNPAAVAWLGSRIADLFPGEGVSGLDIVWRRATYHGADASSTTYTPGSTIHIDLGNAK
jgi:hypothetical protein